MTNAQLVEAWPHIRAAIEILIGVPDTGQATTKRVGEELARELGQNSQLHPEPIDIPKEFEQAGQLRGVIAAVARDLGLSHEHVRQVARNGRKSPRVAEALRSEIRKRHLVCTIKSLFDEAEPIAEREA